MSVLAAVQLIQESKLRICVVHVSMICRRINLCLQNYGSSGMFPFSTGGHNGPSIRIETQ